MSVSIIIVSYNTKDLLKDCLNSLIASQTGDYDIWIVDNASTDGSADMVESDYPNVNLIRSTKNLGFGRANNLAALKSDADYIMLLNPDTVLTCDLLGPMVRYLEEHPEVGVVGPKVLWPDGDIQLSCELFPTIKYELAWQVRSTFLDKLFKPDRLIEHVRMQDCNHDVSMPVQFLWATCWLVRRQVIDETGLFDETFRLYDEDLDFCARLARTQWQAHYLPSVSLIHIGGMSSTSLGKAIMMRKGRSLYYRIHRGIFYALAYKLLMFGSGMLKMTRHALLGLVSHEHWSRAKTHFHLAIRR
ncbi:glycosyltransferase family 2 protein [bacterium]|nr:glycosyltransferase family 2 protein [bacterium]